jgi:hypothetical protein
MRQFTEDRRKLKELVLHISHRRNPNRHYWPSDPKHISTSYVERQNWSVRT